MVMLDWLISDTALDRAACSFGMSTKLMKDFPRLLNQYRSFNHPIRS